MEQAEEAKNLKTRDEKQILFFCEWPVSLADMQ